MWQPKQSCVHRCTKGRPKGDYNIPAVRARLRIAMLLQLHLRLTRARLAYFLWLQSLRYGSDFLPALRVQRIASSGTPIVIGIIDGTQHAGTRQYDCRRLQVISGHPQLLKSENLFSNVPKPMLG